jgi:hypothetical protein
MEVQRRQPDMCHQAALPRMLLFAPTHIRLMT